MVVGRDHVRDVGGLSALLCGGSARYMSKSMFVVHRKRQIRQWRKVFHIPDQMRRRCTPECIDFVEKFACICFVMCRLVTSAEERMGRHGVSEIMAHPWLRCALRLFDEL